MNRRLLVIATIAVTMLSEYSVQAQIAAEFLVPTGALLAPTGARIVLAPLENQAYAEVQSLDGSIKFLPNSSGTTTGSLFAAAIDLNRSDILYSLGYANTSVSESVTFSSTSSAKADLQLRQLLGQITANVSKSLVLAAFIDNQTQQEKITATSFNGSGTVQFTDVQVGFSTDVSPGVRIGAFVSPAVSASTTITSGSNSIPFAAGHGVEEYGGVAFNQKNYSVGADTYQRSANVTAQSQAKQGVILHGRVLLDSVLLQGSYHTYQFAKLVDGTNYIAPPTTGSIMQAGVVFLLGKSSIDISATSQSESGSNFGNAAADATRFDTLAATIYTASFVTVF